MDKTILVIVAESVGRFVVIKCLNSIFICNKNLHNLKDNPKINFITYIMDTVHYYIIIVPIIIIYIMTAKRRLLPSIRWHILKWVQLSRKTSLVLNSSQDKLQFLACSILNISHIPSSSVSYCIAEIFARFIYATRAGKQFVALRSPFHLPSLTRSRPCVSLQTILCFGSVDCNL